MGVELEGACRGSSELFAKETYFFLCNPLVHTHVIYSKCILYLVGGTDMKGALTVLVILILVVGTWLL